MYRVDPILVLLLVSVVAAAIGFFLSSIDQRKGRRRLVMTGISLAAMAAMALFGYALFHYLNVIPAPAPGVSIAIDYMGLAVGCAIVFITTFIAATIGYASMIAISSYNSPEQSSDTSTVETGNPYQPPSA